MSEDSVTGALQSKRGTSPQQGRSATLLLAQADHGLLPGTEYRQTVAPVTK